MKKRSLAIVKRYGATAQRSGGAVRTEKLVRRGQGADRAPRSFIVGQVLTEGRYAHAEPLIKQSFMIARRGDARCAAQNKKADSAGVAADCRASHAPPIGPYHGKRLRHIA